MLLAVVSCSAFATGERRFGEAQYYWRSTPAGHSAQLLTLFCKACENADQSGRDIPLVAVLRDTLGDVRAQNDRISYVWLLTYSSPSWEKRVLSAIPFFYWKIGDGSNQVRNNDLKPLMNLSLPQRSVVSSTARNVIQWTILDPLSMPVRSSSRAYQNNRLDHERLHLEEAESYLQSAPISDGAAGLNAKELDTVIARLELRKSMLGDFVNGRRAVQFGEDANIEQESTRARNWELLRQCADKTGLLFESIDLAGAKDQYAVLWYSPRSAPPSGTQLAPIWKLLNLKDPYAQRERLLEETHYQRTFDGKTAQFVPLGVYSLTYPKMPLLLIDFLDPTHVRRHELTQRTINEITSGVIGISRLTNWYYFVGADIYDFYVSRKGTATNQQERLNCYSKFRVALALDQTVDVNFRAAMQKRVNSFSVNPLETSPQSELRAALQRYDLLSSAAAYEDSPVAHRLENDRRRELASFEETKGQEIRAGIFHYSTLGLYTRRAKGDDFRYELRLYRQVDYYLNFLDGLTAAGTMPEVAYDSRRIQSAVSELMSLLPEIKSLSTQQHAQRTIETLQTLSGDQELKAECTAALDSINGRAPVFGGGVVPSSVAEGSGSPETLR